VICLATYIQRNKGILKKRTRKASTKPVKYSLPIVSPKDRARRYLVSMIAKYTKIQNTNPEIVTERINQLKQELDLMENGKMPKARYNILLNWAKDLKSQQVRRIEIKKAARAAKKSTQDI
jgi:hypothetical protein